VVSIGRDAFTGMARTRLKQRLQKSRERLNYGYEPEEEGRGEAPLALSRREKMAARGWFIGIARFERLQ
jgi:hypothetical protein